MSHEFRLRLSDGGALGFVGDRIGRMAAVFRHLRLFPRVTARARPHGSETRYACDARAAEFTARRVESQVRGRVLGWSRKVLPRRDRFLGQDAWGDRRLTDERGVPAGPRILPWVLEARCGKSFGARSCSGVTGKRRSRWKVRLHVRARGSDELRAGLRGRIGRRRSLGRQVRRRQSLWSWCLRSLGWRWTRARRRCHAWRGRRRWRGDGGLRHLDVPLADGTPESRALPWSRATKDVWLVLDAWRDRSRFAVCASF